MTSIKPPSSGPTGPHSLTDTPDVGTAQKPEGPASSSFQTALDQAHQAHQAGQSSQASQASHASQVTGAPQAGATGLDPIAALAHEVEAGRVSLDQAVDRLLDQTLSKVQKHLNGEQLAELSGLLRDALLHDPTLSAMRGEHG